MKFKHGIKVGGVKPEIIAAMLIIEPILVGYNQELVITACRDGKHSKNSKHYLGYAVDLRTWTLESDKTTDAVVILIRDALTAEYYVQNEGDHIHLQFNALPI